MSPWSDQASYSAVRAFVGARVQVRWRHGTDIARFHAGGTLIVEHRLALRESPVQATNASTPSASASSAVLKLRIVDAPTPTSLANAAVVRPRSSINSSIRQLNLPIQRSNGWRSTSTSVTLDSGVPPLGGSGQSQADLRVESWSGYVPFAHIFVEAKGLSI